MPANMLTPTALKPPSSLSEVNAMLANAGFPVVRPDQISRLDEKTKNSVKKALVKARVSSRARDFLNDTFGFKLPVGKLVRPQGGIDDMFSTRDPLSPPAAMPPSPALTDEDPNWTPPGEDEMTPPACSSEYLSYHAYGSRAALCFNQDVTRKGYPTITIDAAIGVGDKAYDWKHKIRLQLTRKELPLLAAVLVGLLPSCEFKNHGEDKTKMFKIENQGNKFFVQVSSKGNQVRAVPILLEDAFHITSLVMKQLFAGNPWLDGHSMEMMLRAVVVRAQSN